MIEKLISWYRKMVCEHEWEYDYASNIPEYHIDIVHQKCVKCGKTRRLTIPDIHAVRK